MEEVGLETLPVEPTAPVPVADSAAGVLEGALPGHEEPPGHWTGTTVMVCMVATDEARASVEAAAGPVGTAALALEVM